LRAKWPTARGAEEALERLEELVEGVALGTAGPPGTPGATRSTRTTRSARTARPAHARPSHLLRRGDVHHRRGDLLREPGEVGERHRGYRRRRDRGRRLLGSSEQVDRFALLEVDAQAHGEPDGEAEERHQKQSAPIRT